MSHSLGPLADHGPAVLFHEAAQRSMRAALAAIAEARYATAACELEAAADDAVVLASLLGAIDPDRSARMLAVADQRETCAYRAWDAARRAEGIDVAA